MTLDCLIFIGFAAHGWGEWSPLDNCAGLGGGWRGLAEMIKRAEPQRGCYWCWCGDTALGPSPIRVLGKTYRITDQETKSAFNLEILLLTFLCNNSITS